MRSSVDKSTLDVLLHDLAGYLAAVDDLPGALAAAREAIEIRARDPDRAYIAVAMEHLSLVYALRGELTVAAVLEGYADAALRRYGFTREFTEATTHDRLTALLREGLAPTRSCDSAKRALHSRPRPRSHSRSRNTKRTLRSALRPRSATGAQ